MGSQFLFLGLSRKKSIDDRGIFKIYDISSNMLNPKLQNIEIAPSHCSNLNTTLILFFFSFCRKSFRELLSWKSSNKFHWEPSKKVHNIDKLNSKRALKIQYINFGTRIWHVVRKMVYDPILSLIRLRIFV